MQSYRALSRQSGGWNWRLGACGRCGSCPLARVAQAPQSKTELSAAKVVLAPSDSADEKAIMDRLKSLVGPGRALNAKLVEQRSKAPGSQARRTTLDESARAEISCGNGRPIRPRKQITKSAHVQSNCCTASAQQKKARSRATRYNRS